MKEDSSDVFRDHNAARFSRHPYEPAIRAVLTVQPTFNTTSIDIVACGSTVGNLLRFARFQERSFRFNFELIGKSIFFIRKENTPDELITNLRGYGHTFPEAYTTWESAVKGSTSHQHIIKYQFGGLRYLIRFEGDGYHKDKLPLSMRSDIAKVASSSIPKPDTDTDISSLQEATASVTVSQQAPSSGTGTGAGSLRVELSGRKIPQQAIFDLKTRSAKREIDMDDVLPRLWVSQIPNFIVAYHKSGLFDDVRKEDVRAKVQEWETENEKGLGRLDAVIHAIVDVAKEYPGQGLELRRMGNGPLELRKLADEGWHALPGELCEIWKEGKEEGETDSNPPTSVKGEGEEEKEKEKEKEYYLDDDDDDGTSYRYSDHYEYSDNESEKDYTACSADHCGYCGHCPY